MVSGIFYLCNIKKYILIYRKGENMENKGKGFGVAALVTGILSIITLHFIIISVGLAVLAVIFGILGYSKGDKGFAKAGLILGIVSIAITILLFLFLNVLDVSIFFVPSWYE